MSALAEALTVAQRRAVVALEKAYCADRIDSAQFALALATIGLTDDVDAAYLLAALNEIKRYGAQPPAESKQTNGSEQATDAQLALIAKLIKEKGVTGPDLPLSKQQAHEVIDAIKQGSYDPAAWTVPF